MPPAPSFEESRDIFLNQASLGSAHTLSAYRRAVDLFLFFLDDRHFNGHSSKQAQLPINQAQLPIQQHSVPQIRQLAVDTLSSKDEAILAHFSRWLQHTPAEPQYPKDYRPYKPATVALRLVGVQRWFSFMQTRDWLGVAFSLENALAQAKQQAAIQQTSSTDDTQAPTIEDLSPLLAYYGGQQPPRHVTKSEDTNRRWELTRLRNHALLNVLADTGGQVSVVLSMNTSLFINDDESVYFTAQGKNNHTYQTHLTESLPMVRAYLAKRLIPAEKADQTPLFISHDARYDGNRMSRIVAWRVVQRAAKAVGLPNITPHDLRHWRAQQLIKAGASLEHVRELLGHRSIHTVRAYYGHLMPPNDSLSAIE